MEQTETSLPEQIQNEITRLETMIAETNAMPLGNRVNWIAYEMVIREAKRAVREQDTVAMLRILPELQGLE